MECKPDWLYGLVFAEVERIWQRAQREAATRPDLFRLPSESLQIQECEQMDWEKGNCLPPIIRQWRWDGADVAELAPEQVWEPVRASQDGAFWRVGLIQFHLSPDRKRVGLCFVLGPLYGRGFVLDVDGEGESAQLAHGPKSMRWVS